MSTVSHKNDGRRLAKYPTAAIRVIGPSIAYIPLTQGLFSLIDEDNADSLERFNWCAMKNASTYYASRNPQSGIIQLHRLIVMCEGLFVDHINRNGLDNRRANLRKVTLGQNRMNAGGCTNTGHKHITRRKDGYFQVTIKAYGKTYQNSMYKSLEDAIELRNRVGNQMQGEFFTI